jgi:hypothetical protein
MRCQATRKDDGFVCVFYGDAFASVFVRLVLFLISIALGLVWPVLIYIACMGSTGIQICLRTIFSASSFHDWYKDPHGGRSNEVPRCTASCVCL